MTTTATIQEKTAALKRRHVLDAALAVFSEKGFRGATIRDVAKAAGVADGTIYNLFENKAALLRALLEAGPDALPAALPEVVGDAMPLRALIAARWASFDADMLGMMRVVLSEALVDADFRKLYRETLLAPAIEHMEMPLCVDGDEDASAINARLITGLFMGLVMLRLLGDDLLETESCQMPDRLADFIAYGLSGVTPAGKKT